MKQRVFVLLGVFLLACGTGMASQRNFDRSLEKRVEEFKKGRKSGSDKIRVIIQTAGDPNAQGVSDEVKRGGGRNLQKFETFDGVIAEVSVSQLEKIRNHKSTVRMSEDLPVNGHAAGDYSFDMAAFLAAMDTDRVVTGGPNAWFKYGVTGERIGIAVLDSGIASINDLSGRVVQNVDMITGSTYPSDGFGHGTHVAGIIGGNGKMSNYKYLGTAPNASIYNVRVLDSSGRGLTSTVIAGIEWVIKNRNGGYNRPPIRVINLSLGHLPTESASTDPLTLACRRAVDAGIVVVVSAGNYGMDASGNTVFGGITSPGTEPSVITVGAVSTYRTMNRADDTVAQYSSRGPTIDGIIKPDVVAPGSKIVAPLAPNNKLAKTYPQLVKNSSYMTLSGTSMAAPVVAAAVALILERNPALKPNAVKAILMYTAERTNKNPLEVGAGYLNIMGAVNLAANIDPTKPLSEYWVINGGLGLTQSDTVGNYPIAWGHTIVWNDGLYSGDNILYNQRVWGTAVAWGASNPNWSTTIAWEEGLVAMSGLIKGQTIVWEDVMTIVWDDVMTIVWDDLF